MFNGLFNGLFGNSEANKAPDAQTRLEQRYIDALRRSSMGEAQQLEQARAQQQHLAARNAGSGGLGRRWPVVREFITIERSDYDELKRLHHWCKNTYPEVYEEWCAMRDLERFSKDEST